VMCSEAKVRFLHLIQRKKPQQTTKLPVFWDMMPCCLFDKCYLFEGICCLHLQGRCVVQVAKWSEMWSEAALGVRGA